MTRRLSVALAALAGFGATSHAQLLTSWSFGCSDDGSPVSDCVNAWLTDVATGQFVGLGSSPSVRNLAADNATGRVFAAGSRLLTFLDGDDGELTEVSSELIVDANGTPFAAPTRFQSLGFANGLLYGSVGGGNSVPAGFYALDPETAVATLLAPSGDIPVFPGLDYNPNDGLLYAIEGGNTDASIVSINIDTLEVTHVADVPLINAGGVSIIYDGVAVGDGKVFLSNGNRVTFTFTPILVYNIASGAFEENLPSPPKSGEQGFYNSGATFFTGAGSTACNAADLAAPLGVLDLDDVDAFVAAFGSGDSAADVAEPFGVVDLDDIDGFIAAFFAGCP